MDAITYPCTKIKRRIRQSVNKVRIWEAYINSDQRTARNIPVVGVPDSKVHGANMGSTWVLSAPDGPHGGPMNLVIRGYLPCNRALIMMPSWVFPTQYKSINSPVVSFLGFFTLKSDPNYSLLIRFNMESNGHAFFKTERLKNKDVLNQSPWIHSYWISTYMNEWIYTVIIWYINYDK